MSQEVIRYELISHLHPCGRLLGKNGGYLFALNYKRINQSNQRTNANHLHDVDFVFP